MFSSIPQPYEAAASLLPAGITAGPAVHELRAPAGTSAHTGFAVFLLGRLAGTAPILWVGPAADWYPPGLACLGLDPARCLFAQGPDDAACLGTLETALRGGMAGVAECRAVSRLTARRLALAARQGGSLGLLLRHAPARTPQDSTAFATRWLISPAPSRAPQTTRLRAELLYAKGGAPGLFTYEITEAKDGATPPVVTLADPGLAAGDWRRTA